MHKNHNWCWCVCGNWVTFFVLTAGATAMTGRIGAVESKPCHPRPLPIVSVIAPGYLEAVFWSFQAALVRPWAFRHLHTMDWSGIVGGMRAETRKGTWNIKRSTFISQDKKCFFMVNWYLFLALRAFFGLQRVAEDEWRNTGTYPFLTNFYAFAWIK